MRTVMFFFDFATIEIMSLNEIVQIDKIMFENNWKMMY